MRFAYADPPYPGQATSRYTGTEVNHRLLVAYLRYSEGWPSSNRRLADIGWLIAEVDRLRNERASYIADAATAMAEMRAETVAALAAAVEGEPT